MMTSMVWSFVVVTLALPAIAAGQTDAPYAESADTHYFDFWPGTWAHLIDGRPDPKATTFRVSRSVHPAAYEEGWTLVDDKGVARRSRGLRAWDQTRQRWMFAWVSDNGLFQVWDGERVGEHWYIVRAFEVNGERFLSRQAWIPQGPDRLIRIMERSTDGGTTWQLRSRTEFGRVRR
jgi:hypothetical protein